MPLDADVPQHDPLAADRGDRPPDAPDATPEPAADAAPAPDLVARLDGAGRHRDANAAYRRWLGTSASGLAGRRHRDLGVPDPLARQWEEALAALAAGAPTVAFDVRDPATEPPRVLAFRLWRDAEGVDDGHDAPVVAVGRDVTAERAAADAWRASEARYRTLVEATSQAVWRTGPRGEIRVDNDAWMAYTAQYADAATLSDLLWLAEVHPADRDRVTEQWWAAVRAGSPYRARYRLRRHDGTWHEVDALGVPVRDAAGQVVEWFGTVCEVRAGPAAVPTLPADVEALAEIGSWEWDPETGTVAWSPGMYRLMGVPPDTPPSVAVFEASIHPDDVGRQRAAMADALATGADTPPYRYRVERPGEAPRVLEGRARVLRGAPGRSGRVVGTVQDVTERERAQQAVMASEARFRALVEATAQLVWRVDAQGMTIDAFGAIERFTGITADVAPGRPDWWMACVHPDDRPAARAALAESVASEAPYHVVQRIRRRDGAWRVMDARAIPVRDADGTIREWIGAHVDVTEQATARAALEEAHWLRDALINHVPDSLWMKAADGRLLVANAAYAARAGLPRAALAGASDAEMFPPERATRFADTDRAVLTTGARVAFEEHVTAPDGTTLVYETVKVPLRDGEGRIVGTVGAARDVTEQRQLAQQLRHAQKMEALGLLAGSAAHDFNNLLTAIIGSAELARFEVPDDSPAAADLDEVRRTGQRAAQLTRQLLAFSRRQVSQPQVIDLRDLVRESEPLLRRLVPDAIVLDVALADGPCVVRADPGQLEQVLVNLVVNARDAIHDRHRAAGGGQGGVLGVEVAAAGSADGASVALRVRDDGIGIDARTQARIFEPFFTTKPPGEGTGLGLAVVFGVATQNGGTVTVDSAPGAGATFTVLLPAVAQPVAPRPKAAAELPGGTETILLVEDEGVVRETARRMLERHGYTVIAARHGGDAVLAWREHGGAVDLLITDLRMPDVDGRTLVARLRAERPSLPVLVMSGYTSGSEPGDAALLQRETFLAKPFSRETLLLQVRAALDRARA